MDIEVDVELRAFHDPGEELKIRKVRVPLKEWNAAPTVEDKLELVFHWGQNDFQYIPGFYSVSAGDCAIIDGQRWLCAKIGWQRI